LDANADYTSDTKSVLSDPLSFPTRRSSDLAVNDRLVEGPESFTALLVNTTSNASVTEDGSGAVNVTDNDSATVTLSDVADVSERWAEDTSELQSRFQTVGRLELATEKLATS